MDNKNKNIIYAALLVIVIFLFFWSAWSPWIGWCPESSFRLSPESRLPKWFDVPLGYERQDLTVEIAYYVPPPIFKNNFNAVLLGPPPECRRLAKVVGILVDVPNKEVNGAIPYYPSFHVVTIKNITEVIEHKRMEPIFYISDDSEIKERIKK